MRKFLKICGWILGSVAGIAMIGLLIALWMYRDVPADVLEDKYANDASRFMNVAGVRLHYRDEGNRDGPALLLLHANFASLLGWEPWVEALKDDYRIVRFDFTSHGLTGPDPSGDYTMERTLEITEKFIDAMQLETFSIGGTSMGGTVSLLYTSKHPERIENLILLSPGALEGREQKERGDIPEAAYVLKYIMPRALPEFMLRSNFVDETKLSDALIDQWYEIWRREGQREAQLDRLRQYKVPALEDIISSIERPVLLLWGEQNNTAKFEQSTEFIELLENAPSIDFVSYPEVGHMAVQEAGAEIAPDVRAFLEGTLDAGYRVDREAFLAH
jgi:pimeloyl-ACP methyl ester carboxylesterase